MSKSCLETMLLSRMPRITCRRLSLGHCPTSPNLQTRRENGKSRSRSSPQELAGILRGPEMKMVHKLGAQRPAQEADALIGTWRLVEFADLDKDGKWQYRFGEHPRGYFVYDLTGHVHIRIMKDPPLAPFPEAQLIEGNLPSPEHALAAYTA